MPIFQMFSVFTAMIIGFIHPTFQTDAYKTTHVLASTITKVPTTTPLPTYTPTPTIPSKHIVFPTNTTTHVQTNLIDCIGPDRKHLRLTQKACDDFNNAWHHANISPQTGTYGQATKITDHTYELTVHPDDRMATPQELLTALNAYRQKNGVGTVTWSTTLSNYAQSRANSFASHGSLDQHAGFIDFIHNQDGFTKLGFNHLGENAAFAGPLTETHLIEGIFASDAEHNTNQLNGEWNYVGIGISGISIDVVFGGSPR